MRSAIALLAIGGLSLIALAGFALGGGSATHAQSTITIQVGDLWFCDPAFQSGVCKTTVSVSDTITWQDIDTSPSDIAHTVTQCGAICDDPPPMTPLFDSRSDPADDGQPAPFNTYLDGGEIYSFAFDSPGTYLYRCELHPVEMRGQITVLAPEPSPSPQPPPQPSPAQPSPTPTVFQPSEVPSGGGAPPLEGRSATLWWLAMAGGGFLVASAAAVLTVRRLRR